MMEKSVDDAIFLLCGLTHQELLHSDHNKIISAILNYILKATEHTANHIDISLAKEYSTLNFCIKVSHPKESGKILIFVDEKNCLLTLIQNGYYPIVEKFTLIKYFLDTIAIKRITNFSSSIPRN